MQKDSTYHATDTMDFQKRMNSSASMGGPLHLILEGVRELVNDGTLTETERKQYSAFFQLVADGSRNVYDCEGVSAKAVTLDCILEFPVDVPVTAVSKQQLEDFAKGTGVAYVVESDGRIAVNPLAPVTLEEFRKAYVDGEGSLNERLQWFGARNKNRRQPCAISEYRVPEMTGLSRKTVNAYLDAKEVSLEKVGGSELSWEVITRNLLPRESKERCLTKNQLLLNIADYIGISISDREKYENGLRQFTFKELMELIDSSDVHVSPLRMGYDLAVRVSRGYVSKWDIEKQFPMQGAGRSTEPLLTILDVEELVFRKNFPDMSLEKMADTIRSGGSITFDQKDRCVRMQSIRREMLEGFCNALEYQCVMPQKLPILTQEEMRKKRVKNAYFSSCGSDGGAMSIAQHKGDALYKAMQKKLKGPEFAEERSARAKRGAETREHNIRAREIGEAVAQQREKDATEGVRQLDLFFGGDGSAFEKKME